MRQPRDRRGRFGPLDLRQRFEAKFVRGRMTECWPWRAASSGYFGYGRIRVRDVLVQAHRLAYELYVGPLPEGKVLLHVCDNPPCVNPTHLIPGTRSDNNQDTHDKGRHPRRLAAAHDPA